MYIFEVSKKRAIRRSMGRGGPGAFFEYRGGTFDVFKVQACCQPGCREGVSTLPLLQHIVYGGSSPSVCICCF